MGTAAAALAAFALIAATAAVRAQDTPAPVGAAPDLIGTWRVVHSQGAFGTELVGSLPHAEIVIDRQEDAVFFGALEYQLGDEQPDFHDGSQAVRMAKEPFTGVIGWDNRSLTMVERADTSVWRGELLNAETMAMVFFEAGEHAFIARQILVRQ
jgi:hypothetical protein